MEVLISMPSKLGGYVSSDYVVITWVLWRVLKIKTYVLEGFINVERISVFSILSHRWLFNYVLLLIVGLL